MSNVEHYIEKLLAAALGLASTLLLSCGEEAKEHTAAAIRDRDSVSMMTTYGVNTLISDSGVIKYRIVTERWDVNIIRQPNRWEFMKGIFFEQFDEQFRVQAYIQADSAWYYDQLKLWKLRGRVRIRNNNGLFYRSEELYWDGIRHEFYSNVFSRVITPERMLEGTYFRSDEHMTHYTVSNSVGSFVPDSNSDDDTSGTPSQGTTPDSAQQVLQPMRPATQKHAKTVDNL